MTPYAARTGTKRNLEVLKANGWRLMLSPDLFENYRKDPSAGFPYALDNGAWGAYQAGKAFDGGRFLAMLDAIGAESDFAVIPDIVGGGASSLEFSAEWLKILADRNHEKPLPPLYLAVQDGMTPRSVGDFLWGNEGAGGVFVGGTSEWKDATLATWALFAQRRGMPCHVGRVNTKRRLEACANAGVTSFDGSGASRFAKHAEKMSRWLRQQPIVFGG